MGKSGIIVPNEAPPVRMMVQIQVEVKGGEEQIAMIGRNLTGCLPADQGFPLSNEQMLEIVTRALHRVMQKAAREQGAQAMKVMPAVAVPRMN